MKKLVSVILCVALCFTLGVAVFAEPATTPGTTNPSTTNPSTTDPSTTDPAKQVFKDVPTDYYAFKEIMYVYGEGWMVGYGGDIFGAKDKLTRAQFALITYRMVNGDKTDTSKLPDLKFNDAEDIKADFVDAVKFCVENKLMVGYGDNFGPNDPLTRAQFVTVLARMENGKPTNNNAVSIFKDADAIAAPHLDAMNWAVENGLVQGYTNGNFGPNDPLTRQSFCVILYRLNNTPTTTDPVTSNPSTTQPGTTPVTSPVVDPVA